MRDNSQAVEGFTVMELVVVIAITGVLAALLFPALGRAKDQAKRATCLNNLRQINLGLRMYSDDSYDRAPSTRATNRLNRIANWTGYKQFMKSYVGLNGKSSPNDKLFACPADTFCYERARGRIERVNKSLHDQSYSDFSSYGFNGGNADTNVPARLMPHHGDTPFPGIAGRSLTSVKHPTRTILVAEFSAFPPFSWHRPHHTMAFNNAENMVSFVDGHVRYIKIYWNSVPTHYYLPPACAYDPPPGYDYQWSPD